MKYKFKKYMILFFICYFVKLTFTTNLVLGIENNYKIINDVKNISTDKEWKVNFNKQLDETTLKNNIRILDEDLNEPLELKIKYNNNDKFLIINPVSSYKNSGRYMLIVENGIRAKDGRKLSKGVKFRFTTKGTDEGELRKSLLKEEFKNPGNIINNKNDFEDAIKYALSTFQSSINLTINNYNSEDYSLQKINKIINENPILDYGYKGASGNITGLNGKVTMNVQLKYYYPKEKMEYMKRASKEKSSEIIKKVIRKDMSDYEKELAIHDYLINNSEYDKRVFTNSIPQESYTDYGILINKVGVCEGYAKATYRLLNSIGIETIFVVGEGINQNGKGEPHGWNIVKINGEYYQLDVTWDNPITSNGKKQLIHNYFNLTDKEISKDHNWDRTKYPKCNSKIYCFSKKSVA